MLGRKGHIKRVAINASYGQFRNDVPVINV